MGITFFSQPTPSTPLTTLHQGQQYNSSSSTFIYWKYSDLNLASHISSNNSVTHNVSTTFNSPQLSTYALVRSRHHSHHFHNTQHFHHLQSFFANLNFLATGQTLRAKHALAPYRANCMCLCVCALRLTA